MVWLDFKGYFLFDSPQFLDEFPFLIHIWLIHRHRMVSTFMQNWLNNRSRFFIYSSRENLHLIFILNGSIRKLFWRDLFSSFTANRQIWKRIYGAYILLVFDVLIEHSFAQSEAWWMKNEIRWKKTNDIKKAKPEYSMQIMLMTCAVWQHNT